jgi:hypothetical protein
VRLCSLLYTCVNVLSAELTERTQFTDLEESQRSFNLNKEYPNHLFDFQLCKTSVSC